MLLKEILMYKVPVISMLLDKDDDEQEIFDTINSLGERLSTSALLKNFIFKEEQMHALYEGTWKETFESDEDSLGFWQQKRTSGRIERDNIELFLYSYLIIQTGKIVQLEKLFAEYKLWLKDKGTSERTAIIKEMMEYAALYREFPSGPDLQQISFPEWEKRFFHVIGQLEISTVLPLVLFIYRQLPDDAQRKSCLTLLESYLVRRNVCRLTNKNYNNQFIHLMGVLKREMPDAIPSALSSTLAAYTEDYNRFPTDEEFERAIHTVAPYNAHAREVLFGIALYHAAHHHSDVQSLNSNIYSLEHMMPKKWEAAWNDKGMSEQQVWERHNALKNYGNLTLLSKQLNNNLKNSSWTVKRTALQKFSALAITQPYVSLPEWNEAAMQLRATDLYETAVKVWGRPVSEPVASDEDYWGECMGALFSHTRTLREVFDPGSAEFESTGPEKKLYMLKKIQEHGLNWKKLIGGYYGYYKNYKPHVAQSLPEGLQLMTNLLSGEERPVDLLSSSKREGWEGLLPAMETALKNAIN